MCQFTLPRVSLSYRSRFTCTQSGTPRFPLHKASMCPVLFARLYWLVYRSLSSVYSTVPDSHSLYYSRRPSLPVSVSPSNLSPQCCIASSGLTLACLLNTIPARRPCTSAQWLPDTTHACPRTRLGLPTTLLFAVYWTLDCLITLWFLQ